MTDRHTILVTGATGTTGSRVAARLTALGHTVKAATRHAGTADDPRAVHFDWDDPGTFEGALRDVDRIYLVPPVGSTEPAGVMLPFLRQARGAGVRRVVLLSASSTPPGGPGAGQVHTALPDLFEEWAVLRPSWFMQNMTGSRPHAQSIRDQGVIMTATGEGRVGFVDAEDIAAVAVHALTDREAPCTDLVLTGPEALTYGELAAVLTELTGRQVSHRPLTYAQMRERLAAYVPEQFATMLTDMDVAIAEGAEDRTTGTVERVTGQPPGGFREFVRREMG